MNQLGYFGKTPHRGDFVRFNLPQTFIKVWDDWLQQVMIQGEHLGESWPETYINAPTRQFVLSSGIAGATPWIGVFRTSQDKVGRRFPFCLAMSLPEQALPCVTAYRKSLFYEDACALLDRVMDSEYSFDHLQDELNSMAEKHAESDDSTQPSPLTTTNQVVGDTITISINSSNIFANMGALPAVLDTVLQQTLGEYSLWFTDVDMQSTVINSGLPVDAAALALMDSNWQTASTITLDLTTLTLDITQELSQSDSLSNKAPAQEHAKQESLDITEEPWVKQTSLASNVGTHPELKEDAIIDLSDIDKYDHIPSAEDWAALDKYADGEKVVVPEVEPLELEDTDTEDVPWEK